MSVELYRVTEGECVCPYPNSDGIWLCRHWWECAFGVLTHSDPRPDRGEIGHLMVTTPDYFELLLQEPVAWPSKGGRVDSASARNGRKFFHLDWRGQRWTWELFGAHFCGKPNFRALIGKWPD